jgi:hypothetical protein
MEHRDKTKAKYLNNFLVVGHLKCENALVPRDGHFATAGDGVGINRRDKLCNQEEK